MSTHPADGSQLFNNPAPEHSEQKGLAGLAQQAEQSGAKLWNEVYEHRKEIGVAAGTAAVVGLGLYAGREQLGKILGTGARDVLLVEDTPFMGSAMKEALETNGEKVTWVTGVKSATPLTGTTLEGREIVLNPRKFKIALVDGELTGSNLQGEHVVQALHEAGVTSIGTSSVGEINDVMLAKGADIAAKKGTIVSALASNKLDLAGALRSPGSVQRGLDDLTKQLEGAKGKALRQQGDELLTRHMQAEL